MPDIKYIINFSQFILIVLLLFPYSVFADEFNLSSIYIRPHITTRPDVGIDIGYKINERYSIEFGINGFFKRYRSLTEVQDEYKNDNERYAFWVPTGEGFTMNKESYTMTKSEICDKSISIKKSLKKKLVYRTGVNISLNSIYNWESYLLIGAEYTQFNFDSKYQGVAYRQGIGLLRKISDQSMLDITATVNSKGIYLINFGIRHYF